MKSGCNMNQDNILENKPITYFGILIGILFKPYSTWKRIAEEKIFRYVWQWFFTLTGAGSAILFFQPFLKAVPGFFLYHIAFWLTLLIIWIMLIVGLKIAGVQTCVNFTHLLRFIVYNSTIEIIYYVIQFFRYLFFPELKSIYRQPPDDPVLSAVYYVLLIIEVLYWIWFAALMLISVKHVYRLSFKRTFAALFTLPAAGGLLILSILIIKWITA